MAFATKRALKAGFGPPFALLVMLSAALNAAPAHASSGPIITDYAGTGTPGAVTPGPATSSPIGAPTQVAVDSAGNVYIADAIDSVIEKVTPKGTISVIAGNGTYGSPTPGPATSSSLSDPEGVAVDGAGNVYIGDFRNDVVEKVTPSGNLSILAGTGAFGQPVPGPATSSPVWRPTGLAVDSAGDVFISAWGNHEVLKVTPAGTLSIFAGNGILGPPTPGPATNSSLAWQESIATDGAGDVYIADTYNQVVEKVTPAGLLSIIAGTGTAGAPTPGPATSSQLNYPEDVSVDSVGNLYIADIDNNVIEKVTPAGNLSIVAGNGTRGAATFGQPPTASPLDAPTGLALNPDGTLYISEYDGSTVDRVGLPTPGQARLISASPTGGGSAQLLFAAPTYWGASAITGYQFSLDGGSSWSTLASSAGPDGTLSGALNGLTPWTKYSVLVRALNSYGPGPASLSASFVIAPSPTLSGAGRVGKTVACLGSGSPSSFAYEWDRDGLPIPGATSRSYLVRTADQGHTLTCTVTAGGVSATSAGVLIPIFNVSLCPKPAGRLAGTHLGPMWLGLGRARARRMLPRYRIYSTHTDTYCLAGGWGIRAGYATRALLRKLPGHPHASGIILLLTANPHYSLDGITTGMSVKAAEHHLSLGTVIHLGRNWWYVIEGRTANLILKTRHGRIQEIGIANRKLSRTGLQQAKLLAHF